MNERKLTAPQLILKALDGSASKFSLQAVGASTLIVECWHLDQYLFGLSDYGLLYPDSNKVLSYLMGKKGLVARGLIEKVAPKTYRITESGRRELEWAEKKEISRGPRPLRIKEKDSRKLLAILDSDASARRAEGLMGETTYSEAKKFWEIGGGSPESTEAFLEVLEADIPDEGYTLSNGRHVSQDDITALIHLNTWLMGRYKAHLAIEAKRKEKFVAS